MDIETYELGQLVRLTARFTNAADRPIDPTTVRLTVTTPAGSENTYVFGTDVTVVKDSVGNYHFDQSAEVVGVYSFRWWSTGSGQAAQRGRFVVEQ